MDIKRRPTSTKPAAQPTNTVAAVSDAPAKSGNKRRKILIVVSAIVVCGVLGYGIYQLVIGMLFQQKLSEIPKPNVSIETKDGRLTLKGPNGKSVTTGSKLPQNFPPDVLIYNGANIRTAIQSGDSTNVIMYVPTEIAKVTDAYKKESVAKGWKLTGQGSSLGKVTVLSFEKDGRRLSVQLTASTQNGSNGTGVNLTVGPKK